MALVRLPEIVNDDGLIEDRVFDDDELHGPAMIAILEGCRFESNTLNGTFESLFLEIEGERELMGAIGLRRVTIRNCRLDRITFIGPASQIRDFANDFLR